MTAAVCPHCRRLMPVPGATRPTDGLRWCRECGERKPLDAFDTWKDGRRQKTCRACLRRER